MNIFHRTLLKYLFKLLFHPFLFVAYFFSYIVPRNKKIWVFGCWNGKKFADNAKYLFLFSQHKKNILPNWITKNKGLAKQMRARGYRSYYYLSLKGIYYTLRAKCFIFDSHIIGINFWLSGGCKKINLWHGIPFKKIEFDIEKGKLSELYQSEGLKKQIIKFFSPWIFVDTKLDFLLATSDLFKQKLSSAFRVKQEKIFVSGQPRNDILFKNKIKGVETAKERGIADELAKRRQAGNKIILYAPTFRDTGGNVLLESGIDLEELNEFLKKRESFFLIKFHPSERITVDKNFSQIKFIPADTDIYTFLKNIDILITDYSSLYFDFLLLDRPIIFFPYDLDKYINKDRELYFDYHEFTPGPKTYGFQELLELLEKFIVGQNDKYNNQRAKIRDLCFSYQDGKSAERIFDFLYKEFYEKDSTN
jgi:CDP-glycerol glycerophosphotransferase (TagB/SpsB family)